MVQKPVSVLVVTYNPVWDKLKATLKSVLAQEDIDFEIIVSDDGSKNNLFDKIENLFSEYGFSDYELVANASNAGTVANVAAANEKSSGEYVRPISPGDLLYDRYVLRDLYQYAKKHSSDILFGNMVCYKRENDNVFKIFQDVYFPKYPEIYHEEGNWYDRIIANIILKDNISGASIFAKNDVYKHYMSSFLGKVKYVEDMFMKIALLEGKKIDWIDQNVLWYEYNDGGISTTRNDTWTKLLQRDENVANRTIVETAKRINDDTVNRYISFVTEKNKFKKKLKRLLLPRIRKIKHRVYQDPWHSNEMFTKFFYSCWND